jgi:hypothetical protein
MRMSRIEAAIEHSLVTVLLKKEEEGTSSSLLMLRERRRVTPALVMVIEREIDGGRERVSDVHSALHVGTTTLAYVF